MREAEWCAAVGADSLRGMKTIGMIGGMSWESSAVYYRLINRAVQDRLGGIASAKTLLYSFDFSEVAPLQNSGKWVEANALMAAAASSALAQISSSCAAIPCTAEPKRSSRKFGFRFSTSPIRSARKSSALA